MFFTIARKFDADADVYVDRIVAQTPEAMVAKFNELMRNKWTPQSIQNGNSIMGIDLCAGGAGTDFCLVVFRSDGHDGDIPTPPLFPGYRTEEGTIGSAEEPLIHVAMGDSDGDLQRSVQQLFASIPPSTENNPEGALRDVYGPVCAQQSQGNRTMIVMISRTPQAE